MPRLFLLLALMCASPALGASDEDPRQIPLIDQRSVPFRLADLSGHRTLITFVASRCTDACPIAEAAFYRLYQRLERDRVRAKLVTITLDPDYDTPFVMSRLAEPFHVDPRRWRFASGSPTDVRRLMRSFGVVTEKDRHGVPDVHTTFVYLLDEHVRLAQSFLLSTSLVDDVERALQVSSVQPH